MNSLNYNRILKTLRNFILMSRNSKQSQNFFLLYNLSFAKMFIKTFSRFLSISTPEKHIKSNLEKKVMNITKKTVIWKSTIIQSELFCISKRSKKIKRITLADDARATRSGNAASYGSGDTDRESSDEEAYEPDFDEYDTDNDEGNDSGSDKDESEDAKETQSRVEKFTRAVFNAFFQQNT